MKYMIISDIHGGINELNKVLDIYYNEHFDKLIILGDIFNYGIDLNRKDIINKLNLLKESIIYVRGNCDNNINDLLFEAPFMKEININNNKVLLTHGHLYSNEYLLGSNYDIIIYGHTHVAEIRVEKDKLFINPGSISKPRKGEKSFAIIDEKNITIRNLNNKIIEKKIYNN